MELVTKSKQNKKVLVKQFQIEKKNYILTRHVCRNDQYYHQDNHLINRLIRKKNLKKSAEITLRTFIKNFYVILTIIFFIVP